MGCLMYAATSTRPDIAFAVHYLCRCLQRPTPELIAETDHVLLVPRAARVGRAHLHARAGAPGRLQPTRRGRRHALHLRLGRALAVGGALLGLAAAEVRSRCRRARPRSSRSPRPPRTSSTCASSSAASASARPAHSCSPPTARARATSRTTREHHDRMKHVQRRHFFVRDMVESLELEVPFVRTADNIADFFTKPFDRQQVPRHAQDHHERALARAGNQPSLGTHLGLRGGVCERAVVCVCMRPLRTCGLACGVIVTSGAPSSSRTVAGTDA